MISISGLSFSFFLCLFCLVFVSLSFFGFFFFLLFFFFFFFFLFFFFSFLFFGSAQVSEVVGPKIGRNIQFFVMFFLWKENTQHGNFFHRFDFVQFIRIKYANSCVAPKGMYRLLHPFSVCLIVLIKKMHGKH